MKDNIFLLILILCTPLSVYSQGSKKFAAPQFALSYEGKSINIAEALLLRSSQEVPIDRYTASEFLYRDIGLLPLSSKAHANDTLYLRKYMYANLKQGRTKIWEEGKAEMNIAIK
jgi:hypothetical protein